MRFGRVRDERVFIEGCGRNARLLVSPNEKNAFEGFGVLGSQILRKRLDN